MKDSKELAEAHWSYTGKLLEIACKAGLEIARFLYIKAFIHGVKHGKDDRFDLHSAKD